MTDFNKSIETLQKLDVSKMYGEDFFLTWEKSDDELQGVWAVADALRALLENAISLLKYLTAVLAFLYSVITLQEHASPLLPLVIC